MHTIAGTFSHHGGTSRSVPALCDALSAHVPVVLVTASPAALRGFVQLPQRARSEVVPEAPWLGRSLGAGAFRSRVLRVAREVRATIVHDHGIWLPSNRASASASAELGILRVVSPRGMLSHWSLGRRAWKKKIAWALYQSADLRSAAAFHATSAKEADEIRALGFSQPIAVVPNGIEPPEPAARPQTAGDTKVALFMSRIHPKKGVLELVQAWGALRPAGWELWLAGPDEDGHRQVVQRAVEAGGVSSTVKFLGELDDARKWKVLAAARLFVLPSHDENYGQVVAEALAAGVAVITTTATPWAELAARRAGWIVAPGEEGVRSALRSACALPESELREMGERGRAWALQSLSWDGVALRMTAFYDWLGSARGARPDWILA